MKSFLKKIANWLQKMSQNDDYFRSFEERLYFANGVFIKEASDGTTRRLDVIHPSGNIQAYSFARTGRDNEVCLRIGDSSSDSVHKLTQFNGQEASLVPIFKEMRSSFLVKPSSDGKRFLVKALLVLIGMFLVFTMFTTALSGGAQISSANRPSSSQATEKVVQIPAAKESIDASPAFQPPSVAQPVAQPIESDARITAAESAAIAQIKGKFAVGAGKDVIHLFTDPNCPHCRRLESSLASLPPNAKVVVIPVAYQVGSKELVAKVLCSKDTSIAWRDAVSAGKVDGKVCSSGEKLVAENNKLFESLRLSSTPSFVSPGGVLFSGFMSPDQLTTLSRN
jgi:protein-disulfide isomerase